jgi:conserved domain protein
MTKKSIFHYALSSLLVGGIALSVTSCADDDINPNQGNDGDALVRFSINDVQEQAVSRGLEMTRGAIANGITAADLAGHKLAAHSNRNIDVCFIETTVEGVNPIKADAHTRANIATAISGDFSSTGIRGVAATSILTTPEWFKAAKTKSNGELYTPIRWSIAQPWARFFAVYPSKDSYSKLTINDMTSTDNAPSVDFTVEPNVRDQKDFMTACTGEVHYATQFEQPTTNLDFRHALTAIRFAVGQNLSWNKTIDKVEIRNAIMKSKYKLSNEFSGIGATWDNTGATRGTATLSGLSVNTSSNPNVTIMGTTGDNFTFYMIPQVLTGNSVTAYVHFTDNTEITATLKGEWKAGTTRTLKLSETNSTWQYVLTPTDPSRAANYDETTSQAYGITSYRQAPDGTQQAVAWKVVGYSVDGGTTYTPNKPAWMTALSKESGNGGTAAEQGTATLTKDVTDLLKLRNDGLKNATAVGSASAPYDLSLHDHNGNATSRNTANSYLISAPGHYRIPLVYGNAIKNGATNSNAYETTATGTYVLQHFQDHAGQPITNPWIEKTNSNAYANIDGAKIVWSDEKDLVTSPTIAHDASGDGYLDFEVKATDIKSGNAVVAVTKGGTVVWSWHLWFAPKSALTPIPVTNYQGKTYNFTTETLGWKPKGEVTTYNAPRTVKVKVEQTIANGGAKLFTVINITQNNGGKKDGIATFYQFGRKDALPGTNTFYPTNSYSFDNTTGGRSLGYAIQHPENMFIYARTGSYFNDWCNASYYNLWSADNTTIGWNDNAVVKTVYDPSPVGFKMPASNAFTGFTSDGQYQGTAANINVDGTADSWDKFSAAYGHNFYTNSSKNATIFFPAWGRRNYDDGLLSYVGLGCCYWAAVPNSVNGGCILYFDWSNVNPQSNTARSCGFAARPVSE